MTGQRDWLRARAADLPTEQVPLPASPSAWAIIEKAIALHEDRLRAAADHGPSEVAAAQARLAQARADLAAQPVKTFTVRCVPPAQWDALIDQHPPSEEQRAQGWQWHVATFRPAVLDACVVPDEGEDPIGVRGWVEVAEEGEMTPGELELLFATAVQLNARQPRVSVGKGSPQTPS